MSREKEADSTTAAAAAAAVGEGSTTEIDWSAVFSKKRIKSLLQETPDVGRLPTSAVDLVGTCSALFVRQLVGKILTMKQSAAAKEDDQKERRHYRLTLQDVRRTIQSDHQSLRFLQGTLDDLGDDEEDDGTTTAQPYSALLGKRKRPVEKKPKARTSPPAKRKPRKKKQQLAVPDASVVQEALKVAADSQLPAAVPQRKEIVPDEEDYD
jgi:hypothetical protein